jgi:uncharacterized protein (TIGR03437 family)
MIRSSILVPSLGLIFIAACSAQSAARLQQSQLSTAYTRLPMSFEPSGGPADSRTNFVARGEGYALSLSPTGGTLSFSGTKPSRMTMTLIGANPSGRAEGNDQLPGKSNYLVGSDPAKWRTSVPNFARVRYREVYPGVDMVYYGNQQQLEYDLVVNPGGDARAIQLAFAGIQSMRIGVDGDLILGIADGEVRQHKPVIYQEVNGIRRPVEGHYVRKGRRRVGFELADYDRRRPLVIDPRLIYSTYLAGTTLPNRAVGDKDQGDAIAIDSQGSAYVTGWTTSSDFPIKGTIQPVKAANTQAAFVTKMNASGTAVVYSTYLGGSFNGDEGRGIAVDSAGNAYVVGRTHATNFPVTPNAYATARKNGGAFVTVLNAAGDGLIYSTYLGAPDSFADEATAVALDAAGNAYVTGITQAPDFPVTLGAYQSTPSFIWVAKLNPSASGTASLVYSTYFGKGGGTAISRGIAVDSSGSAYITGDINQSGIATPGAFQTSYSGGSGNDAFVAKFNATGSGLVYSTYLGGSGDDAGNGIAVDAQGNAYVAGSTISTNFPITPGAFQTSFQSGRTHGFVTKLNPAGNGLVYSTFLAGTGDVVEQCNSIAVDFAGNAYVAGNTNSITFPITPDGFRNTIPSAIKGFAAKLSAAGDQLVYSTYLAGDNQDFAYGIAVDAMGNAFVTGYSASANFPVTPGAFQTNGTPCCTGKAFVTAIAANTGVALTQSGFTFQAVQGGGAPSPKTFRFFNATSQVLNFTVAASTISGGSWLSASPAKGSVSPDQPVAIAISVNPGSLSPGDYYGQVRIDAPGAPNAPQFLTVVLNVTPPATNPGPVVEPTGLTFVGLLGATTPAAQSVRITNLTSRASSFTASGTSASGPVWFTISPASGTVAPNQPVDFKVQPNSGLPAGVYRGSLVLQFPQDATTRTVDLLLVVTVVLNPSAGFEDALSRPAATGTCTPSKLLPVFTLLGSNFIAPASWPAAIEVSVLDDCGSPMRTGSVVSSFSNGDSPLNLTSQQDGHWSATWAPSNPRTASMVVTVTAQQPEANLQGTAQIGGNVQDNPEVPFLPASPMVSAGSYQPAPSPGELVSVFGVKLADGTGLAPGLPLQTQLQGSQLVFAGRALPLVFASAGQVNAVVPYSIAPGATYQLIAQRGTRLSLPRSVTLAPAEPAIFTTDSSGKGQGHIYVYVTAAEQDLAAPTHPAKAGDILIIYCAGLGAVTPAVDAGVAVNGLTNTVNPVGVTIGNVPATVLFSGLTSGFTGLYQLNVMVPPGVPGGDGVPVVVSVAGVSSAPVTMSVQN